MYGNTLADFAMVKESFHVVWMHVVVLVRQ